MRVYLPLIVSLAAAVLASPPARACSPATSSSISITVPKEPLARNGAIFVRSFPKGPKVSVEGPGWKPTLTVDPIGGWLFGSFY